MQACLFHHMEVDLLIDADLMRQCLLFSQCLADVTPVLLGGHFVTGLNEAKICGEAAAGARKLKLIITSKFRQTIDTLPSSPHVLSQQDCAHKELQKTFPVVIYVHLLSTFVPLRVVPLSLRLAIRFRRYPS